MRLACGFFVAFVAFVAAMGAGCGFDAAGQSDLGGTTDDSSVGGDGIFPTDDGAVHGDTKGDTHGDGPGIDTTPTPDTTPSPDTTPPPDTCVGDGGPCSSPGHCATGVYACSGGCSATDPSDFGTSCTSPMGCGSAVACDGSCPDPATVGDTCSTAGCDNGTIQCNLACALPPSAHSGCIALACAVPVYADCFGVCPPRSTKSGKPCVTCVCGGGLITIVNFDDCGACPGCPSGCTEDTDAGLPDAPSPG
jgi:hypothetical protein